MSVTHIDPKTTALVIIDLQKGIVATPAQPHTAEEVIGKAVVLADRFRALGGTVVLVHVEMSPDGADRLRPDADEPLQRRSASPDYSEFVDELRPCDGDIIVTKRQWGAFYGTDLDLQLRRRGIRTIVLAGICANYGVESTARDAHERAYDLVFAEDAMSTWSIEDHVFAVGRIFPLIGRVAPTNEIVAALEGRSQ